jgi:hypothetical protein
LKQPECACSTAVAPSAYTRDRKHYYTYKLSRPSIMAPVSVDQEKQQELQGAAAPVYMQLPGPGPAALPTNNFNVQYTYATYSPPSYPSLADPHSINPYVAAPSCLEYPPQQYPAQQYPASYSPQQYVASSSPQPCAAAPPSAAAGTAVTGYPAVAGYPVQPTAVATTAAAPGQGIPAALPADQAPQGFCTVTTALFLVSGRTIHAQQCLDLPIGLRQCNA